MLLFLIEFLNPILYASKTSLVSDIKNQQHSINISIIDGSDSSKSLSSSRIPYLHLHHFPVLCFYYFLFVLHSYCGSWLVFELACKLFE